MTLELSDHDMQLLRDVLRAYLPALTREVARTDDRALRHTLVERQEVVEKLLTQMTPASV